METRFSRQLQVFALLMVAVIWVQVSAWDEKDFAALQHEAEIAKANGVRYLVEHSGYRDPWVSDFHCRVPLRGERLVMQLATPSDPGRGYRCTYWITEARDAAGHARVTWSRSAVEMRFSSSGSAR